MFSFDNLHEDLLSSRKMIVNILNGLLKEQITCEEIFNWLTTDKPHDIVFPDFVQTESTRAEFVLFFLDYLRKQCSEVLQHGSAETENPPLLQKKGTATTTINEEESFKSENQSPINTGSNQDHSICLTSTPLRKMANHSCSFENKSLTLSPLIPASPIAKKYSFHTIEQASTSAKRCSLTSASVDSSMCTLSLSTSCAPMSPLYTGGKKVDESINELDSFRGLNLSGEPCKTPRRSFNDSKNPTIRQSDNSGSKRRNSSGQKKTTMSLGDFLVTKPAKSSKKNNSNNQSGASIENTSQGDVDAVQKKNNRSRRRIKPTMLQASSNEPGNIEKEVFGVIIRPETKNPQFLEAKTTDKSQELASFKAERELLKLERQRQPKVEATAEFPVFQEQKGPTVSATASVSSTAAALPSITPNPDLIDNKKILDKLSDLYGNLIHMNLVPNPMTELYFVMTLITSQFKSHTEQMSLKELKETMGCKDLNESIGEESETDSSVQSNAIEAGASKKYLNTPHNCVYFATTVLNNQRDLLIVLDRATIKLLLNRNHVAAFKPELKNYLNELYEKKVQESNRFKEDTSALTENVCFQMDTDNRGNFPSTVAFSKFRMQRDLFYETLKIWEDKHLQSNWSFPLQLERKIHSMLTLHDDAANYYHLARLFKSQLLSSCLQFGQTEEPIDPRTLGVLNTLKSVNLEKFKQLQERLVTPLSSEGPVPLPSFRGIQEFYRDFLLYSKNLKFTTILENCFIQEIIELNETPFASSEVDNAESNVDETTRQNYLICVSSLRLLSKFLGFLVSIPFESPAMSLTEINSQIALRSQVAPPINLQKCLFDALIQRKLVLTVPWMVEYLAVLDPVAFRLPNYTRLCEILYYIYRTAEKLCLTRKGSLLITFNLGWLFELPNFPRDLYHIWQSNFNEKKVKDRISAYSSHCNDESFIESSLVVENLSKTSIENFMDKLDLIDDRAIQTCCSFLKEFKILLISGNCDFSNNTVNRHITPVSSELSRPSSETKAKTLQLQQEAAFFHGQSDSLKKTVDFVSERIASNCVKLICREILPEVKSKNFKIHRKSSPDKTQNGEKKDRKIPIESLNSAQVTDFLTNITKELREECNKRVPQMCIKRCKEALLSLLPEDTHEAVKDMSVKICLRLAMERIDQWLDFYINDAMASKKIYSECLLSSSKEETEEINTRVHNSEVPSATEIINQIRESMWELIEKRGVWSALNVATISRILRNLERTLKERQDLEAFVERILYVLSVDYAFHLIVFGSTLFVPTIEDQFIDIWKGYKLDDVTKLFEGIMSFRNIRIIMPTCDSVVWRIYGRLLKRLLREKLLSGENFSDQCVELLRRDWPHFVTKFLPECLNEAIQGFTSFDENSEKMKMLLDWISVTCSEFN